MKNLYKKFLLGINMSLLLVALIGCSSITSQSQLGVEKNTSFQNNTTPTIISDSDRATVVIALQDSSLATPTKSDLSLVLKHLTFIMSGQEVSLPLYRDNSVEITSSTQAQLASSANIPVGELQALVIGFTTLHLSGTSGVFDITMKWNTQFTLPASLYLQKNTVYTFIITLTPTSSSQTSGNMIGKNLRITMNANINLVISSGGTVSVDDNWYVSVANAHNESSNTISAQLEGTIIFSEQFQIWLNSVRGDAKTRMDSLNARLNVLLNGLGQNRAKIATGLQMKIEKAKAEVFARLKYMQDTWSDSWWDVQSQLNSSLKDFETLINSVQTDIESQIKVRGSGTVNAQLPLNDSVNSDIEDTDSLITR